jgi:hypothetical protein
MGLKVVLSSASATPSSITSGDTTSISVTVMAVAENTRAMAEYFIDNADPVVFGNDTKRMHSDLVFVTAVGVSLSSRLSLKLTTGAAGQVTVAIKISERDINGARLGPDFETAVVIEVS